MLCRLVQPVKRTLSCYATQIFFGTYLKSILKILRAKYPYALVFYSRIFLPKLQQVLSWNCRPRQVEIVATLKPFLRRKWYYPFLHTGFYPCSFYWLSPSSAGGTIAGTTQSIWFRPWSVYRAASARDCASHSSCLPGPARGTPESYCARRRK